jgi:hypothetical protein
MEFYFTDDILLHSNEKRVQEIREYIEYLNDAPETTETHYTGLDEYFDYKYRYVSQKLDESGFVNGRIDLNTFEENPNAHFWWEIHRVIHHDYGFDHHCSTADRKKILIAKLEALIETLERGVG